jgi:hypothetical protein
MSKVVIEIGYKKYIVNADEAIKMAAILSSAEIYETTYTKDHKGDSTTMQHVYPQEEASRWFMEIMPDSVYRMAKLAGKPSNE